MVTIGSASARISAGMDGFLLSKSATRVALAPGAGRQVTTGGIALILIPIVTASVVLLAAGQQVGSAFREGTMDARQIVRISVTPRAGVAFRMPIAAAGSRARMGCVRRAEGGLIPNVDCSGTASWNSGRGFDPIAGFDGSLNGNGFVISDLTINRPTTDEVGVFKRTLATSDTIWNVGLSNVSVVGRNYVGALVGRGAKYILRTYVTGSVSGESYVGGLAGEVIYSLSDTYSKATVTASVQIAGGLAGSLAGGSIERSYATGNVTAPAEAGGLIGYVDVPSVTGAFDSFATGNVSGAGTKGAVFGHSD